jgi:hypothetical protein
MAQRDVLEEALHTDDPSEFRELQSYLPREWIDDVLQETGRNSVRQRRLPAFMTTWVVIAMALFRDRAIDEVVAHLGLARGSKSCSQTDAPTVGSGVIAEARKRLGAEPMKVLFYRTSDEWSACGDSVQRWRGLALLGLDGIVFRVADEKANAEEFGLPGSSRGRSAYPQARVLLLTELRTHLFRAGAIGPYRGKRTGELSLAREVWGRVPSHSLVVLDRGLVEYGALYRLNRDDNGAVVQHRHWLVLAKKRARWNRVKRLGDGDAIVEVKIGTKSRKEDPDLPPTMQIRAIVHEVRGFRPKILLTSLLDVAAYPAREICSLRYEGREVDIGHDELKTHMLERQETLRSKRPEGVKQEVWGLLIAYNLVRRKMIDVSKEAGVEPIRISFRHTLQVLRMCCLVAVWAAAIADGLGSHGVFRAMIRLLILPPRRRHRHYERHVKARPRKYKRNPGRRVNGASNALDSKRKAA